MRCISEMYNVRYVVAAADAHPAGISSKCSFLRDTHYSEAHQNNVRRMMGASTYASGDLYKPPEPRSRD